MDTVTSSIMADYMSYWNIDNSYDTSQSSDGYYKLEGRIQDVSELLSNI